MKKILAFVGVLVLAGCSKEAQLAVKTDEFRQKCAGDHTVSCRTMMIDVGIAKLRVGIEKLEEMEDKAVACYGRDAFDAGIALVEEKIDHYDDMKPNIFKRLFMSGAEIEFSQPPFKRESEFAALITSMDACRSGQVAALARQQQPVAVKAAEVLVSVPTAGAGEVLDANAEGITGNIATAAGLIAKTEAAEGSSFITLNGQRLFKGADAQWQTPHMVFKLSNQRDVILVDSSGGRGNSCETLFFFLVADASGVKRSPLFGTCSAKGTVAQNGDTIKISLPKVDGMSHVTFDGTTVNEDGVLVALDNTNDPSL